jgi:hypothetical protein
MASKCPICKEPFYRRWDKTRPEGGRMVHRGECARLEERRVHDEERAAESRSPWFKLTDSAEYKKAFRRPPLPQMRMEEIRGRTKDGVYSVEGIYRILGRKDRQGFQAVLRLMERMLQRQTQDELQSRRTKHLNSIGFSQADASPAIELMNKYKQEGYSRWLHYRMSKILSKYVKTQLLGIMNQGAREYGQRVVANPRIPCTLTGMLLFLDSRIKPLEYKLAMTAKPSKRLDVLDDLDDKHEELRGMILAIRDHSE